MSSERDRRLRQLFRESHAGDAPPPFERLSRPRRSPARPSGWPLRLAATVAAAALAIAVAVGVHRERREREALEFARQIAAWEAPTDALLELPSPRNPLSAADDDSLFGGADAMFRWRN